LDWLFLNFSSSDCFEKGILVFNGFVKILFVSILTLTATNVDFEIIQLKV